MTKPTVDLAEQVARRLFETVRTEDYANADFADIHPEHRQSWLQTAHAVIDIVWPERAAIQAARGDLTRPRIVCLCGSTRFYEQFQQANYDETMAGRIVLSVGFYPHAKATHGHGEGVGHDSAEKAALDELHKRKIDLADEVYVLNVGGYIGDSTRSEIEYAAAHGKTVRWLEHPSGDDLDLLANADTEPRPIPAAEPRTLAQILDADTLDLIGDDLLNYNHADPHHQRFVIYSRDCSYNDIAKVVIDAYRARLTEATKGVEDRHAAAAPTGLPMGELERHLDTLRRGLTAQGLYLLQDASDGAVVALALDAAKAWEQERQRVDYMAHQRGRILDLCARAEEVVPWKVDGPPKAWTLDPAAVREALIQQTTEPTGPMSRQEEIIRTVLWQFEQAQAEAPDEFDAEDQAMIQLLRYAVDDLQAPWTTALLELIGGGLDDMASDEMDAAIAKWREASTLPGAAVVSTHPVGVEGHRVKIEFVDEMDHALREQLQEDAEVLADEVAEASEAPGEAADRG